MKNLFQLLILTNILLQINSCSLDSNPGMAGGGSEAGNGKISGRVVTSSSQPVTGALIRLRPSEYSALDSSVATVSMHHDLKSDKNGVFLFDNIPKGFYTVEIINADSFSSAITCTLATSDDLQNIGDIVPEKVATVTGTIVLPDSFGRNISVGVKGLDRKILVISGETFDLTLPSGQFTIDILVQNDQKLHGSASVIVAPNERKRITVSPYFGPCDSYRCDSLVVQTILDINTIKGRSIRDVSIRNTITKRITELYLNDLELSVLPDNIGSLSYLEQLDLSNNRLSYVPTSIENCQLLTSIEIGNNILSALPPEIGKLKNLLSLSISVNQLTSLPPELGNCTKLEYISGSANRLTSIPSALGQLVNLQHLSFNENKILSIPSEIAQCKKLKDVYFDYNALETLPAEITTISTITVFQVRYNKLCFIPDSLGSWISQKDSQWKNTQICNK